MTCADSETGVLAISRDDLGVLLDVVVSAFETYDRGIYDIDDHDAIHLVEAARRVAELLDRDPLTATPEEFVCRYTGSHKWRWLPTGFAGYIRGPKREPQWYCDRCSKHGGHANQPTSMTASPHESGKLDHSNP